MRFKRGFLYTRVFVFITLFSSIFCVSAQNTGFGVSGLYNFQSEGYGIGARLSINPSNRLSIVPQASYYFPSNLVHEFTIGLAAEYKVWVLRNFHFYGLAHAGYNNWLNYESSPMEDAKPNNWNFEAGGGVSTNGCWRPFLEGRYNVRFRESHIQLGILYVFGCNPGHGVCPAYR